jgi:hypothetical protein
LNSTASFAIARDYYPEGPVTTGPVRAGTLGAHISSGLMSALDVDHVR